MEMISRYGTPSSRVIKMMKSFEFPFRNVQPGDSFVIFTDDAMDPSIWQTAMAWLETRGADALLAMYSRREYHCADPSPLAVAAAMQADVVVALTTTCLNSGTPGLRGLRAEGGGKGQTPIWLMEEINQEILCDGGGRANAKDIEEICALQGRIGDVYDHGKTIHITSASGTDVTADISGMPEGWSKKRYERVPFGRNPETGKMAGGTWPFGEVHVEPVPGTTNGVVVWDQTAHIPSGRWQNPVRLDIENGRVIRITGGGEARAVEQYLTKFGDGETLNVGGEMAIGTNRLCPWGTGTMRSEKKRYGAMHFGVGHGADRGQVNSVLRLEGIIDAVSISVDDFVLAKDGDILV